MAEVMRQEQAAESGKDTLARAETLPSAQPPTTPEPLKVGEPATSAGGVPAVVSAMKHAFGEMGPVRGTQTLLRVNQKHGFDCPGCAWPDPKHRTSFEFCENGAKAVAEEATKARVTPEFFRQWSLVDLAAQTDHWLGKQGRLTHPMVLREGATHYEPISWDEAFALIAEELNALASPDEACFYTSGRTSNEAAFLYQLFVRQFGTNNLPDCSNMCHESSGTALNETHRHRQGHGDARGLREGRGHLRHRAEPGHQPPAHADGAARRPSARAAASSSINPLPEAGLQPLQAPAGGARHPRLGHAAGGPVPPGAHQRGRGAAAGAGQGAAGGARRRAPGTVVDRAFVEGRTLGFEAYAAHLGAVSWEDVVEQSGVSRERIETAAEWLAGTERIIFCWAMGLTQHRNAVGNIQEIVNLPLLRGSIGKPGAGVCPVRGHSNVQGDRTMGIWERPRPAFLDALSRELGFEPPRQHGLDTVGTIQAMHEGRVKVFFAMGGNFLSATPDTERTAEALRRTRLTVHVSTKLNRAHLVTGKRALILPCLGRTERDVQAGWAAVRHGGELDGRGARLARDADAGLGAPAQRAGHRGETGAGGARRRAAGWTGRGWWRTTTASATSSRR